MVSSLDYLLFHHFYEVDKLQLPWSLLWIFPLVYSEFHMWVIDTSITLLANIFIRSQSVETWCSYISHKNWFWKPETFCIWTHTSYVICLIRLWLSDIKINSFFGGFKFCLNICCCASLLKGLYPLRYYHSSPLNVPFTKIKH